MATLLSLSYFSLSVLALTFAPDHILSFIPIPVPHALLRTLRKFLCSTASYVGGFLLRHLNQRLATDATNAPSWSFCLTLLTRTATSWLAWSRSEVAEDQNNHHLFVSQRSNVPSPEHHFPHAPGPFSPSQLVSAYRYLSCPIHPLLVTPRLAIYPHLILIRLLCDQSDNFSVFMLRRPDARGGHAPSPMSDCEANPGSAPGIQARDFREDTVFDVDTSYSSRMRPVSERDVHVRKNEAFGIPACDALSAVASDTSSLLSCPSNSLQYEQSYALLGSGIDLDVDSVARPQAPEASDDADDDTSSQVLSAHPPQSQERLMGSSTSCWALLIPLIMSPRPTAYQEDGQFARRTRRRFESRMPRSVVTPARKLMYAHTSTRTRTRKLLRLRPLTLGVVMSWPTPPPEE
ncbi:hypothetical protein C8T65DRAFT_244812 [Cerioporus squamosus]|nr:hypothetical protein C8T65DRAFT_244812 [Cerioporus squamosus]